MKAAEHDNQYGCRKGRSVEDVLRNMKTRVDSCTVKYVAAIFFDIKGAFDHLWWPSIPRRLIELGIKRKRFDLIRDYLSERSVAVEFGRQKVKRAVVRGCPQGSVLGPYLWCLVFNQVLTLLDSQGIDNRAYMDDLCILLSGTSRVELQHRGGEATRTVQRWCHQNKLRISETKADCAHA